MSIWGPTRSVASLKAAILSRLRELGATRMEAHYSGGNDEGGVDSIDVFRPVGKTDYLLWELRTQTQYEDGKPVEVLVRSSWPSAGPFPNKKAALAAAQEMPASGAFGATGKFEAVKVEGELVKLVGAEGAWEDEDGLFRLVDDLLEHDFGTWAGDFSASGVVYATVEDGRVWREGESSYYAADETAGEY
jgi:hypothetical protein